jgi:hypothetical protein
MFPPRWTPNPKEAFIPRAFLEKILDDKKHPARNDLIWKNGYFLTKSRKSVFHPSVFHVKILHLPYPFNLQNKSAN